MIAGVENTTPTWFGHTVEGPEILAGVAGKRVKEALREELTPQIFTAATVSVPVVNVLGTFITIDVPLFVTIEQPEGTVQL